MRHEGWIPVGQLVIDRMPLNPATLSCANAILEGVEMPPIKVQALPDGRWKVRDGRHRAVAHKLTGKARILAKWGTR
jgi:hypothetical protein